MFWQSNCLCLKLFLKFVLQVFDYYVDSDETANSKHPGCVKKITDFRALVATSAFFRSLLI